MENEKNVITSSDLDQIRKNYIKLQGLVEAYKATIIGKKQKAIEIREIVESMRIQANHLVTMGEDIYGYISKIELATDYVLKDKPLLWCFEEYHREILYLITYLLSRRQQNFISGCIFDRTKSVGYCEYEMQEHVDLIAEESIWPKKSLQNHEINRYIQSLFKKAKKSFIVSKYMHPFGYDDMFYYELVRLSKNGYFLGDVSWRTVCFINDGDDAFKETIMKLMLFADMCGLDLSEFNEENKEEYAKAIESMDISDWSLERGPSVYPKYLHLVKKLEPNHHIKSSEN